MANSGEPEWRNQRNAQLTLALLFDEIVIVPADAYLPRCHWRENNTYYNPDLGLRTEWDFEIQRQLDEEMVQDLQDEGIRSVLRKVPPLARQQILRDSRHEIYLAQKYGCPIVCVGGRRRIIELIIQRSPTATRPYSLPSLVMADEYLRMVGPIFEPKDLDTLVALKKDHDLRTYATSFCSAMEGFRESADVRSDLLRAMQTAMSSASLSKNLAGVFDGTATAMSAVGLIPFLGTAASVVGLGSEGATKALEQRERSQSWFEFAGQVKRVASLKRLEKLIAEELTTESGKDSDRRSAPAEGPKGARGSAG